MIIKQIAAFASIIPVPVNGDVEVEEPSRSNVTMLLGGKAWSDVLVPELN